MGKPKSQGSKAQKLAKKKALTTAEPTYSIDELLDKVSGEVVVAES